MKKSVGLSLKMKWLSVIILVVLCFPACGGKSANTESSQDSSASYYAGGDIYMQEQAVEESVEAEEVVQENTIASNRKLIKNVSLDVETEEFDSLVPKVEARVQELGGYIEGLNMYNGSSTYGKGVRNAYMTIRIPKDKLDSFVTDVAKISNVIRREENTQDVTLQYVDMESRKKSLQIEQERLLVLLEQAENIEDIIVIEERLSQVRYELESMESQLRTYDNLVDYSTINLTINEVEKLTPVEEVSAWEKMGTGFVDSLVNVGKGLKNLFIFIIVHLPYIVIWAVIVFLFILLIRYLIKKNNKKLQHKKEYGPYPSRQNGYPSGYGKGQAPVKKDEKPEEDKK